MDRRLLLGIKRFIFPVPRAVWQKQVMKSARGTSRHLSFMSTEHHQVREFVVRELPRFARPLEPELIAAELGLSLDRVQTILDELEAHMTFLFRNENGAVTWAYPVTVDETPHRLSFSSGEQIYAA